MAERARLTEIDGAKLVNRLRMRARFEASKAPSSFENVNPKDVEAVDTWIAGYLRGYDEGEERMSSYRYQDTGPVPTEEEIAISTSPSRPIISTCRANTVSNPKSLAIAE